MTAFFLRAGFAVVAIANVLATAHAQPLPVPVPAPPKVIRWPGGWMMTDGSEMILRSAAPGAGTTNIISNSGNGFGNRIVIGNGSSGGTTVVRNSRNGIGNRIILDPADWLIDLNDWGLPPARPAKPPAVAPAQPIPPAQPMPPVYEGKANPFWQQKAFSEELDCSIYWSAADKLWYRFHAECDKYKPLKDQPPAPKE